MGDKIYLHAEQMLADAYLLGEKILAGGFIPDLVIGVWRGGTPIAIAIHELLLCQGIEADHIPIRSKLYKGIGQRGTKVQLDGLDYVATHLDRIERILIVDDVFDSGLSMAKILSDIDVLAGEKKLQCRVAVPWFKPENNLTAHKPDYFLHTTSAWLVFPHELCGLSQRELLENKPGIAAIKHLFK
ncbi:MAG: hypoxanthine phosphoribosyltransferase [Gammaproteobacteria bacterium]|nr:hypoxanthine phosphoribosyltransferase [Gammaproteobacteria bacterium]MBQ0839892.1 hypoxanthine phosphoribosyltransferase [Gammaproteobacteria bacterium]